MATPVGKAPGGGPSLPAGKAPGAAPASSKPAAAPAQDYGNLLATPPPGVPMSYWQQFLNSSHAAEGLKWLKDPTKGGGFDRFKSKDDYLQYITQAVTSDFRRLPAVQNNFFFYQNKNGGIDPDSAEGNLNEQQKTIDTLLQENQDDLGGLDESGIEAAIAAKARGDAGAEEQFQKVLAAIKNPEIAAYVGDYAAHLAHADPRDIEAQQRQLAKFEELSDPRITAEEKLMNEMAQRDTENTLRGQRGALKNDLLARGMYGSGAELTQNMMSQQEAASREALARLQANANAQTRAMSALQNASDLSTSMRGSSASEDQFNAGVQNSADQWNREFRKAYDEWKFKSEQDNNTTTVNNAVTTRDGAFKFGQGGVDDAKTLFGIKKDGVTARTVNRNAHAAGTLRIAGTDLAADDNGKTKEEVDTIT